MIVFFITWYLMGMLIWCTVATLSGEFDTGMENYYYTWQQVNYVLLVAIILLKPNQVKILRPVFVLVVLELIWQLISWATGLNINNSKATGIFFIIVVIVCIVLFIKDLTRWQKLK